ncbi:arginine--tRNA ligase [Marivirga tractuosa]|uniref:Arginine--tRNA ligase n=1 Tax=Marivirga tractuosa (strain ATCC 23168 / DSM 4126 / NBRC 15989 / NCIMB 1408 / VKM B-1430 / H-43) TaxID=643867 RepID=E4TVZ7_MARTH|nr:arginine--tRNA ligase [Marivirga tractuosa]ADR23215.1 arginyl-tRNA synthetase [Marivirga tractuosa DSM 4126]BDD16111.1 arginine--tRNA ligase [Marivirga tractuosa]
MLNLTEELKSLSLKAFKSLFEQDLDENLIQIQPTRKEFEGSHTLVCFPLGRFSKLSPEQTAKAIGEFMQENSELVSGFNVVKGFLNIVFADKVWLQIASDILNTPNFGFKAETGREVMVEYSSPNTNKPLHLGHLRNNFLGYSVAQILKANGNKVHKVQIINDRGIHICKSMVAWQKFGEGETPESSGMKGDKLVGKYYVIFDQKYKAQIAELVEAGKTKEEAEKEAPIMKEAQEMLLKWEQKEPETYALWEKMNGWVYKGFENTYKTMGVDFDKLYYESQTFSLGKEEVLRAVEEGLAYKKEDGSVWIDLTEDGLDEKLLLRKDGTSVYMTQDIGTAILRYRDFPKIEQQIYTVGNEQEYHFKVLFIILAKLGYKWAENCYHLSYGMVDLPTGKMKSREGTVVDADDLMEDMFATAKSRTDELGKIDGFNEAEAQELYRQLGLGALKYYLLKVDPVKRMMFNPEESIDFQGNTGPFIQYVHARICAILRKAEQLGIEPQVSESLSSLEPTENNVLQLIIDFPNKIEEAANGYAPSIIANYVYEVAKAYNKFYSEVSIFNESDKDALAFRIGFSRIVAETIEKSMNLLGAEAPTKM